MSLLSVRIAMFSLALGWGAMASAADTPATARPEGQGAAAAGPVQTGQGHEFVCAAYSDKKICIVSPEGKITWEYPATACTDLWVLPNSNVLFTTGHGVKEVTRDKKVVYQYDSKSEVFGCQRLANGNTFVAECNSGRLLELDPKNKVVKELCILPKGVADGKHGFIRNARRLENGHYLVAFYAPFGGVREYDSDGRIVMEIPLASGAFAAVRLPNGNTLIARADRGHNSGVLEVDCAGKTVWEIKHNELPGIDLVFMTGLQRLPNGNTILSNWLGHGHLGKQPHLIEVTRDKKVVWTYSDHRAMKTIATIQLLDVPGDATKGKIMH